MRKFHCKICNGIFTSTKEWNKHFEENHPLLSCQDCGKMFHSPTSLYQHHYVHNKIDKVFPCTKCECIFLFVSQLESHMFTHRKIKHFPCTMTSCNKTFKTEWNLHANEKSHQNPETKCEHCDYMTTDLRYLKQHSRVHSDVCKHSCPKCEKGF